MSKTDALILIMNLWPHSMNLMTVLFPDIPYQGYGYNSISGIPDQHALEHVWSSSIKGDSSLTWCSLSHCGQSCPGSTATGCRRAILTPFRQAHMARINLDADIMDRYQPPWSMNGLSCPQFIRRHAIERDFFILVGDHQPRPWSIRSGIRIHDYAVPLHVLAKAGTSMISWRPISSRAA